MYLTAEDVGEENNDDDDNNNADDHDYLDVKIEELTGK